MTKYHELQITAKKSKKRVGRGISAGQGKTAGRGTKGQKSRTGKKIGHTFMGGQGALVQRIPKAKGFKSLRAPAQVVYTGMLNDFKGTSVDNTSLFEAGLIASPHHTVKIITKGELSKKLNIKVQAASESAQAMIKKAGGTFTKIAVPLKQSTKSRDTK
jgi:large subunit ribosomal protein L15